MSKRKGRKPLNLDNSDDSEPEEAGTMPQADEAEIKNRVMKVAKRRIAKPPGEGGVFNSLNAAACLKSQSSINLESTFAFLKKSNAVPDLPAKVAMDSLNGSASSNSEKNLANSAPAPPSFKRACRDSPEPNLKSSYSPPTVKSNKSVSPSPTNGDNRMSRALDVKELSQKDSSNPILEQVEILNIECLQWAQEHIDKNPLVDLRPVFKDYNQYFESILEEFHKSEASKPKEVNASSETLVKLQNHIKTKSLIESNRDSGKKLDSSNSLSDLYSPNSIAEMKSKISHSLDRLSTFPSLLGNDKSSSETIKNDCITPSRTPAPVNTSDSSLKVQSPSSVTNSAPKSDTTQTGFSFGRSSSSNFSFGNSSPKPEIATPSDSEAKSTPTSGSFFKIPGLENNCFSNPNLSSKESSEKSLFGNAPSFTAFTSSNTTFGTAPTKTETEADTEDAEDQPPVMDVKPIIEEGSKYTARCKVFIKKEDNSYADKGVGTLSLKCVENSEKCQLVVRAESTLGNILVNVLLSKDIPVERTGKNNVLLVCLPTPDSEPPPRVVLLRVKTPAEADELHQTLKDSQV